MLTKAFAVTVLLAVAMHEANAAVAYMRLTKNKDAPNTCAVPDSQDRYEVGSTTPMADGVCGVVTCENAGDFLTLHYTTCGAVGYPPECGLVVDNTKTYPECCPQVVCPGDNETDSGFESSDEENEIPQRDGAVKPVASNSLEQSSGRGEDRADVSYDVDLDSPAEASLSEDPFSDSLFADAYPSWFARGHLSAGTNSV